MKNRKVCHFASVHTTTDTRVFHRECVSLAKHFDVTYIGIGNNTGIIDGVNVIAIPKPPSRIYRLLFVTWNVFFLALKQRAQIYHIHDAELIPFAFVLSVMGKKVIYDVHENTYQDIMHKPWIPFYLRWFLGKLCRVLEWIAANSMHIILVIAKPEFAKRFIVKKYSIIQNFADLTLLRPYVIKNRASLPENNLFYMGMVTDYYYNLLPVIKAIALLKRQGTIVHFHCVGYIGNYIDAKLSKHEAYQAIQDQLHFYGYKSVAAGFEISKKCKFGICIKNQPEEILVSHERKFFEYMAIGLPIISCDSHIYKNIVDQYQIGLVVNIASEHDIADAITQMLRTDLDEYAQNGIKACSTHFNWQSQSDVLIDLYNQLLV